MDNLKCIIKDYYIISKKTNTLFYDIYIPSLFFCISLSFLLYKQLYFNASFSDQSSNFIALYGVLIAFTTAMLSIVATSSSSSIEGLKKEFVTFMSGNDEMIIVIDQQKVTLYRDLISNISFSLIIQSIFLIINLLFITFQLSAIWSFSFNFMFTSLILITNIKSTSKSYLAITCHQDN